MRRLLGLILLCGAPVIAQDAKPLTELEQKFQGIWRGGYTIVIEGRTFCADTQPGEWYEGDIIINPDADPPEFDFVIQVQSGQPNGNSSQGIYRWDGDTLIISAPTPGEARPKDFSRDPKRVLLHLTHDGDAQHPASHCLGESK